MLVEKNTINYKIVRRTSPYNKYIKWFRECYAEDGRLIASEGYKTEKEARDTGGSVHRLPVGNRILETTCQEIR